MLRLDVDKAGAKPEIFAKGLRNPWRYSFDPQGRLIVADVGQDRWEELHIVQAGDNLGWADIYRYYLEGQYFDITGAPYGDYEIRITADPNNKLVESNNSDNLSVVRIRIGSGGATVLSPAS